MARVRGQDHPTAGRRYPDSLQPASVASHQEGFNCRRNDCIPIVEHDSLPVDRADHSYDVVDLVSGTHEGVGHLATSDKCHFPILEMKPGIGKQLEVTGVIEVHVSDHDVRDVVDVHAENREAIDRRLDVAASPPGANLGAKTRVDDAHALVADGDPQEVVHVNAAVVRIATHKKLAPLSSVELCVLDGVKLIHAR